MRSSAISVLLISIILVSICVPVDADQQDARLLVDYGNGSYVWLDGMGEGTMLEAAKHALDSAEMQYVLSADGKGFKSIGGTEETSISSVKCEWRFYLWTSASYSWSYGETDGSMSYQSGTLALGFFPDGSLCPASTPFYSEVWTQAYGDASSSYNTGNTAPDSVAQPLEWVIKGTHGNIDTSLVFAEGLLYCIAGGSQNAIGEAGMPCIYCIDTETHDIAWSVSYSSNTGYEIMSPIIVGGMLIVSSGNAHVYAYDRMTGEILSELVPEGQTPVKAASIDVTYYKIESIFASDGSLLIDGPSRITGATTPVYDSGLLYFNTYDGAVHCFSILPDEGFKEIWSYVPDHDADRGSFYSNPPVVTKLSDGSRVVLAGNYAGKLYCIDADTGSLIWMRQIVSYGVKNPGAVSGISVCSGDRAIVCATDGGMTVSSGRMSLMDLSDGSEIWSLNVFGKMTVVGDTAYGYIAPSVSVESKMYNNHGVEEDAVAGFYALKVSDGRYIWKNESPDTTKSGMVYSDGRLYCIDYSPGTDWPSGGAVRCIDAETGSFIWSIKVEPFDGTCYSMSAVTIIDGKIYAANDGGYVYCLSTISSKITEATSEIDYRSAGLMHWSWIALILSCILVGTVSVLLYRK